SGWIVDARREIAARDACGERLEAAQEAHQDPHHEEPRDGGCEHRDGKEEERRPGSHHSKRGTSEAKRDDFADRLPGTENILTREDLAAGDESGTYETAPLGRTERRLARIPAFSRLAAHAERARRRSLESHST